MSVNVREAALNSLIRCEQDGRYANIELDSAIKKYRLEGVDRSFFTTLVYGVIERRLTIDYLLSKLSSRPLEELDLMVLHLLRLGTFQILWLDRTPDHAAVNETVEQAKRRCGGAAGFVNGILRNLIRAKEKGALPYPDPIDRELYLSVKYSVPEWICRLWSESYGDERAEEILRAVNRRPHLTLRVNTCKTTREDLLARLAANDIEAEAIGKAGILLKRDVPIGELPIEEGLCFVQDLSSQRCAEGVEAHPGETVLDCCACPGGKSFALAMEMENQGRLLSLDLHDNKLSLIRRGAERMGLTIIETQCQDGSKFRPEWQGSAHRVLCDVPCSGLGVMAKKPDLRYKREEEISRLPAIQLAILTNCSAYVIPGGRLIYSTCTLNPAENEQVVAEFLAKNPEFTAIRRETTFPDRENDGFFTAVMQRNPI